MTCTDYRNIIERFLGRKTDYDISRAELRSMQRHMDGCWRCSDLTAFLYYKIPGEIRDSPELKRDVRELKEKIAADPECQ